MYPISSPIFPVSSRTMTLSLFYILAFSHIKTFPFPESTMYVLSLSLSSLSLSFYTPYHYSLCIFLPLPGLVFPFTCFIPNILDLSSNSLGCLPWPILSKLCSPLYAHTAFFTSPSSTLYLNLYLSYLNQPQPHLRILSSMRTGTITLIYCCIPIFKHNACQIEVAAHVFNEFMIQS